MKTIGFRIVVWYVLSTTATLGALFFAGYLLLERHLIHGLDLLNTTEFAQIKARLGTDYEALTPQEMETRIRETTEYASVLFFIDVHAPKKGLYFLSANLKGQKIPDVTGNRTFIVQMPDFGELRVSEFVLPPFEVVIATPMANVRQVMTAYRDICAGLLIMMLLVSAALGAGLSKLVLRPVRLIRDTACRIGSDNLSERIPVAEVRDEISDLAKLLNQMFDRIEASFEQVRRFTGEASHELKTPLSLVRLHAEKLLGDDTLGVSQKEAIQVQLEEVGRLNQIIDELLLLSRAEAKVLKIEAVRQDPRSCLLGFAQDATVLAEHYGMRFTCFHHGEGLARFDEKWMRQVLFNLLTNAINVSPPGGLISLISEVVDGCWRVSIEDEGPGLAPEQRERIFERFVRIGLPGVEYKGSGLGLAISRSIVKLHGGEIRAMARAEGQGLRMVFELPFADTMLSA